LFPGARTAQAQGNVFSNALSLNGVNQYVSVPNGIWFSNQFTVEAWVYPRSFGSWARLMEFGDGPGTNNVLCAFTQGPTGQPIFQFYNGSQGHLGTVQAPASLPLNAWTHLAFTFDGTNGTILTNGVAAVTGAMTNPPSVLRTNNYIGRSLYAGDAYANAVFDDFRLWSTARSAAQIQANLGHPLTGGESNLILYYRFDETNSTVATNSATATGAADNGNLVNDPVNVASTAPATLVLNTNDFGPFSLRSVVSNAPAGLTITFATNLSGATILLTNGMVLLNQNVTIDASSLPGGITINGNQHDRVFEAATNATVVLNSLTITNGLAGADYGGGIYNLGNLTVNNCTVAGNSAEVAGGAFRNTGTLTLNGCILSGNTAGLGGTSGYGGAIASAGLLTLNQTALLGNSATFGGGIYIPAVGIATLNQSTLSTNSSPNGGAIYNAGTLAVNQSTLTGNSAVNGGGGGIESIGSSASLTMGNCTIALNSATFGAGLWSDGSTVQLTHCTICSNYGDGGTGGLVIGPGTVTLSNTIVANNLDLDPLDSGDDDIGGSAATVVLLGNNLIGYPTSYASVMPAGLPNANGQYVGTVANPLDPLLAPLGFYGGPTPTMPPQPGSIAINTALNSTFSNDQRGLRRPLSAADIGAVESRVATITTTADSGAGSLRQAIANAASDFILFATNLSGQTILLTGGDLIFSNRVTIDGSALAGGVSINGHGTSRVFYVPASIIAVLKSLTVTNGNAVSDPFINGYGGGIFVDGSLTLNDCTLAGNAAEYSGGGIQNNGYLTMNQCTVAGNIAGGFGGGICNLGELLIDQCTISTNSATGAGGIYNEYNGSQTNAGTNSGSVTVINSIVAGNEGSPGEDIFNENLVTRVGTNIIQDLNDNGYNATGTDSGPAAIDAAPQLAPLANYGGLTATMPPLPGSPAIGVATNTTFPTDQRGYIRPLGAGSDIGSVQAAWPGNDAFGNALSFNGTQYVSVPNFGSIAPTNEVTVEFWAYTTQAAGQQAFVLNPDLSTNRFQSHINYGGAPNVGVTYWDFGNIIGAGRLGPENSPPNSISNWVHYALVASHAGNYMSIYTNGVLCAGKAGMTPFVRGTYELRVGGGSYYGLIDEFRIWNYARSQGQILSDMNQTLTGGESGLVLYYPFDSVGGNVVTNAAHATGAAFNGTTINNPTWENATEPSTPAGGTAPLAYTFSTLAGFSTAGSADGVGNNARFSAPTGVAVDAHGNVYVADTQNSTIRKITPAAEVTTLAGLPGSAGFADGTGGTNGTARFNRPGGVAVDNSGNVYVGDYGNRAIRKISTNGLVSTITNVPNLRYNFYAFEFLALDASGAIYSESGSSIIKLTPVGTNWVETTLAGDPFTSGHVDGASNIARFENIAGLTVDQSGNLYVCDISTNGGYVLDNYVRKITPGGVVTTIAGGGTGPNVDRDGVGTNAQFIYPVGLAVDSFTNLYVGDGPAPTLRKLTPSGTNWTVTTFAGQYNGTPNPSPSVSGVGTNAQFGYLLGVAVDTSGNVYVADNGYDNIDKVTPARLMTTLAGPGNSSNFRDGTGAEARFYQPTSVSLDSSGNIYVADNLNHVVRLITPAGEVTTLGGQPGVPGEQDGVGNQALFNGPRGVVVDGIGNVYVTDALGNRIREISPAGIVSTIAGTGTAGYLDAVGTNAQFNYPAGIALDGAGNLYVADQDNDAIRMITPNHSVSTIAGSPISYSGNNHFIDGTHYLNYSPMGAYADGLGTGALFNNPSGIAVDSAGNLYVADTGNFVVRKIAPLQAPSVPGSANWFVTTLAGIAGINGSSDGTGVNATFGYAYPNFSFPGLTGVAVDSSGNVFVTDDSNNSIRKITPAGVVTTVAGLPGNLTSGGTDGTGQDARFNVPFDIAVDSAGALYVADQLNNTIRKGVFASFAPAFPVPFSPPAQTGQLSVTLLPPEANGQWRLSTEVAWRNSGTTAAGLAQGEYTVEFRDIPGYLAIPLSGPVAVTMGATTYLTNDYYSTFIPDTNSGGGSLTINIGPSPPAGAGWRFLGDTGAYYPPGYSTNLAGGNYLIQFAPVAQFVTPASLSVQVQPGFAAVLSITYLLASPPPANVLLPTPVPFAQINDLTHYPFGYNGQLQTDVGYGSGVAVQTNVVLTAAHLIFNDQTLSFVNQASWLYQEEAGMFAPAPQPARGWYALSGYASQRSNDVVGGLGPDQSSPQSRNMDVAALYFPTPVANGGYGGYLPSDTSPNTWLTGAAEKMLVGYPVDGSQFGVNNITNGVMYETGPLGYAFGLATDPVADQQVYTASWLLSFPGNSGGPLYVQYDNYYYPAAVYLGTLFNGTLPYASAVRAIDSNVVNLITLAGSLGDTGTNYSGGGVVTIIPSVNTSVAHPGYLILQLGPPSAVRAGAAWKLTNQSVNFYSAANPSLQEVTSTNALNVQFKPIPGWILPTNRAVTVTPGLILTNVATYTVTNPVLIADPINGLGISGTTNTTYQIQSNSSLTGTWIPFQTNTLTNFNFNSITNRPRPGFYRAVWLTN
jgi:hypothetical protein